MASSTVLYYCCDFVVTGFNCDCIFAMYLLYRIGYEDFETSIQDLICTPVGGILIPTYFVHIVDTGLCTDHINYLFVVSTTLLYLLILLHTCVCIVQCVVYCLLSITS